MQQGGKFPRRGSIAARPLAYCAFFGGLALLFFMLYLFAPDQAPLLIGALTSLLIAAVIFWRRQTGRLIPPNESARYSLFFGYIGRDATRLQATFYGLAALVAVILVAFFHFPPYVLFIAVVLLALAGIRMFIGYVANRNRPTGE